MFFPSPMRAVDPMMSQAYDMLQVIQKWEIPANLPIKNGCLKCVKQTLATAPAEGNELTPGIDDWYTGGVNHDPNSDHSDGNMELLDSDGNMKSLCELDGDDLEKNLVALQLSEDSKESDVEEHACSGSMLTGKLPVVHPLKCHKLEVSFHAQCQLDAAKQRADKKKALKKIEKLLMLKKTIFAGGPHGLQVKQNGQNAIQASKMAAECHVFAGAWGGHQVHSWTRTWMSQGVLPSSLTGHHAKVYSLFDDPKITMELHTYVHSNKWAVNPQKFADLSKNKLIPVEAEKYLCSVVQDEMPQGVKHYMELELFSHIHLKVGKGISLATAQQWLCCEGFWYTSYKKGLYFDGHDHSDLVQYCQEIFLPRMKEYGA
ncbi:hypothetical protein J3A83DRAFT_4402218 [Scleroderma citrinum]